MAILSLPCGYKLKDILGIFQPRFISFGAERKIVRLRLKNHSAEIELPFGTGLFTAFCHERKLKDGLPILHPITNYTTKR